KIDEAELGMCIFTLQSMKMNEKNILHYATTIMLIQIALDTHEKVTDTQTTRIYKQLTVLAGDYFSGWYYYLLSESRDIQLIGILAEGIREINEKKIQLYFGTCHSFDEVMNLVKDIEILFLQKS